MTMPSDSVPLRLARRGAGRSPLLRLLAAALVAAAPLSAQAWWDAAFKQRTVVTLNTGAQGLPLKEAVTGAAVPVRLHSGNFDFVGAKPDGSDLRVVAADDKTPLKFSIEKFDGTAEMAVLWVQVPTVAPGTDKNQLHVYAGNPQAGAAATPVVDPGAALTLRFAEADGVARDAGGAAIAAAAAVPLEANGLIGASARFDGGNVVDVPVNDRLQAAAGAPYAVSLWARPTGAAGTLLVQGPLTLALDGGKLVLRLGSLRVEGGTLPPGDWAHVGAALGGGKATLYVDGAQAAQADLPAAAPAIGGALQIGRGYTGLVDELQVAPAARSARWLAYVGDWAYERTLQVNSWFNRARARLGLPYWSLSKYLKSRVKRAVSYIGDFEAAVAREARQRGLHGVVCGHIHHAEMREVEGVLYCNDGDWVESLTALVEHHDGRLEIADWSAHRAVVLPARRARRAAPAPASTPVADDTPVPAPLRTPA